MGLNLSYGKSGFEDVLETIRFLKESISLTYTLNFERQLPVYFKWSRLERGSERQVGFKYLIQKHEAQLIKNRIEEFLSLVEAIAGPDAHQVKKKKLRQFGREVNENINLFFPHFKSLKAEDLRSQSKGRGVWVAVIDNFDEAMLEKQRSRYKSAKIRRVMKFGNPVSMNHGNSVIDVILELAPEVTILPLSSENGYFNDLIDYLEGEDHVKLINMSRTFPSFKKRPGLVKKLYKVLQDKVMVKSMGNHGRGLKGKLNARRLRENLGAVGSFDQSDIENIKIWLEGSSNKFLPVLFAISLDVFGEQLAKTTAVPGRVELAKLNALAVPAHGIWSSSTQQFETGTSFAAPQLTALLALLSKAKPALSVRKIQHVLLKSTRKHREGAEQTGRGVPRGDLAFTLLRGYE